MKYGWVVLLLLVAGLMPGKAKAQAEVYGEFSASYLSEVGITTRTDVLYGETVGLVIDGPTWHHTVISADIQGRFVRKSGIAMNGAAAGPRFTIPLKHGWAPYGEFLFGFSRYNSTFVPNQTGATTDAQLQVNGGVAKKVSPHWDVYADYSYSQYYAFGGALNPKSFGAGAIFHFVKR
jgi:hypothetical protein